MKVNEIYKISDAPQIYVSIGIKHWFELQGTKENPVYLLTHPMWHLNAKSAFFYLRLKLKLSKQHVKLIMLANTPAEKRLAGWFGMESHFINQNIHVCEHKFRVIPGAEKLYDAVYIAAAKPYKRIHLATQIKKLFVITYFWPDVRNAKGEWDLHAFEPAIKHADFNRDRIGQDEINRILNVSVCGLALSKKEGAMLASLEYQLAGLPVVTTKSIGGRDVFLDRQHTLWVADNASAVAAGVAQMVQAKHDPVAIRERTLSNLEHHRKLFYNEVAAIFQKQNQTPPDYTAFKQKVWGAANGLDALSTRYSQR